jgi:O-antigen/teichoic acid export membrane protein
MKAVKYLLQHISQHFMHDNLRRNAIFIFLSNCIIALSGFAFWIINAHLFSARDVGLAAALISLLTTISSFSSLGVNNLFLRFMPTHQQKQALLNTGFLLVGLTSILLATLVFFFIPDILPKLTFFENQKSNLFFFIFFSLGITLNSITNSAFIAFRATLPLLIINMIFGVIRITIVLLARGHGLESMYLAYSAANLIAAILSLLYLANKHAYRPSLSLKIGVLESLKKFTFGSYFTNIVGGLPQMLLPLVVVSKFGANQNAYFYMALTIASLLYLLPASIGQSVTVEISYDLSSFKAHIKHAAYAIAGTMIPAIVILVSLSNLILSVFGPDYAQAASSLLRLFAIAGLFVGINYVAGSVLTIKRKIGAQFFVNAVNAIVAVGGTIIFADRLFSVGIVWLVGELINSILFSYFAYRSIDTILRTSKRKKGNHAAVA